MLGQEVYNARGAANQTYKFGGEFTTGVYFVEVRQGKNVQVVKIVKQ